jgi:hypothetical protein
VLAVVAPFVLLRELGRAFAFAHLQMAQALILDIAVAAIQFAALGWLVWSERMSATTALPSSAKQKNEHGMWSKPREKHGLALASIEEGMWPTPQENNRSFISVLL